MVACDRRPIDATAALPAIGTHVPAFALPVVGDTVSITPARLRGAPAVIALWSTHCPFQVHAMAAFDSLAREFAPRGVRFVVLADDASGPVLDSVLAAASWRPAADLVGVARGTLAGIFDHTTAAPKDGRYRIDFVLPSFLFIDAEGRIVRRAFGAAREVFQPALDSLVGPSVSGVGSPAT